MSSSHHDAGLFAAVMEASPERMFGSEVKPTDIYAALLSVLSTSPQLRNAVQDKWTPEVSYTLFPKLVSNIKGFVSYLRQSTRVSRQDKERLSIIDPLFIIRTALIWRYNCFGIPSPDTDDCCLYDVSSMLAHSCAPSAAWHIGTNNAFCLRARVRIEPGDEICICYFPEMRLMMPTDCRKENTKNGWMFECQCPRCKDQLLDLSRGFRCPSCKVGTIYFHTVDFEKYSPCTLCGKSMYESEKRERLEKEKYLMEKLTTGADPAEMQGSMHIFTQHWVAFTHIQTILDTTKFLSVFKPDDKSMSEKRIQLLTQNIVFMQSTFNRPNLYIAIKIEELGDCFMAIGQITRAAERYREALQIYAVLVGHGAPVTNSVREKLERTV